MTVAHTPPKAPLLVTRYAIDSMTVADQLITQSALVTPTQWQPWAVRTVAELTPASLEPIIALKVSILLLATGSTALWPDATLFAHAASHGIGLEVMTLGAAARTYNLLASDDRAVLLAVIFAA